MLRNLYVNEHVRLLSVFLIGDIPDTWRTATIIPIRGKPVLKINSYRPLSLSSAPGKVLETLALNRLLWMADALNPIAPHQSGFRHSRAAVDCISEASAFMDQAKVKGYGAYLLLFDVKSAFDCLSHASILASVQALGITGHFFTYIQASLTDHSFRAKVGQSFSSFHAHYISCSSGQRSQPISF